MRCSPAPKDYAALLHVMERRLSEATKRCTGQTASEIIHERVLLEAKRLLVHSQLSISEVAYRLSIDDPAYFSRFFKKHTGKTPGEYKRRLTHAAAGSHGEPALAGSASTHAGRACCN